MTRPLHIVHTEASCGWGGQEIRILNEAAGLLARGHRVELLTPGGIPIFEEARRRGIPVVPMKMGRRSLKGMRGMRRWLNANRPDVLNTHSSTDSWLAAVATRLLPNRPRIVRTRHISAAISRDPLSRWLYSRGADRVVTTGERLRQTLINDNGVPAERVISVPTGVDTQLFAPGDRDASRRRLGLPLDKSIVGIVSTVRTWKGHRYLIDAIHQLNRPDVLLLIVGHGPIHDVVTAHIAGLNMGDRALMVGQQLNVPEWLAAMDIFAMPSYANEGVPQAIVQAMSCRLPVISTPIGAIAEAVVHEQTGLLVPPREVPPLAAALATLLDNWELRQQYAQAGRDRAVAKFGIEAMLDKMEQIFDEVSRPAVRSLAA
ncbi:MAG: glycosyltransferase family 4 protein [Planctomycetia bacterium]|nr:glycosyltransferase family 4 protein [Planctomycetia bacterium]